MGKSDRNNIRRCTRILENQVGFNQGKSIMEAIQFMRQMEYSGLEKRLLHMVFMIRYQEKYFREQ